MGNSEAAARRAGSPQGIVLILAATLSVMGVLVIAPILPQLMAAYADVPGIAFLGPVILTVPAVCIALFSPFAGWLADRVGRRKMLIAAMLLYAPLGAAPLFLDDIYAILASRIGVGLTEAVIMTTSTTLMGDYFDGKRRDTWVAWQVGICSIAATGLLLLGGLLGSIDWRAPFIVYLSAWGLALATVLLTWEPAPRTMHGEEGAAKSTPFPVRLLALICAVTFFGGVVFYIVPIQLSVVLGQQGITNPAVIGGSAAFGSLGVPLGSLIFRRLSGMGTGLILGGAFLLAGVGLVIMGISGTYELTMTGVLINQLGCGIILPTLLAWVMASLPPEARGRGIGIWTGTFFIGQFFSPILLTVGSKALGSVGQAVVACGVAALVCAAIGLIAAIRAHRATTTLNATSGDPA
ncbi:MFS transporter [Brevundimonas variabilis]|uniref:MFS family permease n=1 Tax=Brevundimonas variabilis TaxID=74312 RepID=A0A7W9FF22_9CAUL|nr:MFS transporter [Brevundimonas variabilis]MBB5747026.1 MFS family permease [Brevundimonas variabilis]